MKAVEVNHLYKSYADVTAVHDLTFCVDPGEILGLIGPNGAGKSSTIKTILDFMKPDSGEVKIFGQQMNEAIKDQIGYLPEERGLYKRLTAFYVMMLFVPLWFFGVYINFPNSPIWVVLSIFPITAPIQMMLRLGVSDIPAWQIVTSIGVLGLSIFVGLSFSVKIFRTFRLMYGKRPGLAEIMRSLKTA